VRDGYDGRENYNAVSMLLKYRPIWPAVAIIKSEISTLFAGWVRFFLQLYQIKINNGFNK